MSLFENLSIWSDIKMQSKLQRYKKIQKEINW
jgi:hypothetical protein